MDYTQNIMVKWILYMFALSTAENKGSGWIQENRKIKYKINIKLRLKINLTISELGFCGFYFRAETLNSRYLVAFF